jgi:hypothetical protein
MAIKTGDRVRTKAGDYGTVQSTSATRATVEMETHGLRKRRAEYLIGDLTRVGPIKPDDSLAGK